MQIIGFYYFLAGAVPHEWGVPFHKPVSIQRSVRPSISKGKPLGTSISTKLELYHPPQLRVAQSLLLSLPVVHLWSRRFFMICQYDIRDINKIKLLLCHPSATLTTLSLHLLCLQLAQLNMLMPLPSIHDITGPNWGGSFLILWACPAGPMPYMLIYLRVLILQVKFNIKTATKNVLIKINVHILTHHRLCLF